MNSLNPIENSLLAEDHQQLALNEVTNPESSLRIPTTISNAERLSSLRKQLISVKRTLTAKNCRNGFFMFFLWSGLFLGTMTSTYLTLLRSSDRLFNSFFPLLVVICYYQVPYFLIGIYACGEMVSGITKCFGNLSIFNIVASLLVEGGMLANILGLNHSTNAEMLEEIFDYVTLSFLVGIPCHALVTGFILKQSINQASLLKEKERLEREMRIVRNYIDVMQN